MKKIFISYRREDAADVTGRINDRLRQHFGIEAIFTDVDNIPLGVNFKAHLNKEVSQCNILLAVIGRNWLTVKNKKNQTRLNNPNDFVRIEIESALERDIPVVPLLVHGTEMPSEDELPESLKELTLRNGTQIRPDPDFHKDMDRLINGLDKHLKPTKVKRPRKKPEPKKKKPVPSTRPKMSTEEWFNKAYETKDYLQKIKFNTNALELNPEYADAYSNRGYAYYNLGEYNKAIQDLNKAIKLDPEYADAYRNRGITYQKIKQNKKAKDDYNKYLELCDSDVDDADKVRKWIKDLGYTPKY